MYIKYPPSADIRNLYKRRTDVERDKSTTIAENTTYRSLALLTSDMQRKVSNLLLLCREGFLARQTFYIWRPFETYRTPMRQNWLMQEKRTKAPPFCSAHQYGLAVDIVPCIAGNKPDFFPEKPVWTWGVEDEEWKFMRDAAISVGLCTPLDWDKPHVEHPDWPMLWDVLERMPFELKEEEPFTT